MLQVRFHVSLVMKKEKLRMPLLSRFLKILEQRNRVRLHPE